MEIYQVEESCFDGADVTKDHASPRLDESLVWLVGALLRNPPRLSVEE